MANAAAWLETAQRSQWSGEPIRNHHPIALSKYHCWPYDLPLTPFPKLGFQLHPAGPTLRRVLPPGEYNGRYRKDFFCIRAMSPFDKLFWPLLLLFFLLLTILNFVKHVLRSCQSETVEWQQSIVNTSMTSRRELLAALVLQPKHHRIIHARLIACLIHVRSAADLRDPPTVKLDDRGFADCMSFVWREIRRRRGVWRHCARLPPTGEIPRFCGGLGGVIEPGSRRC